MKIYWKFIITNPVIIYSLILSFIGLGLSLLIKDFQLYITPINYKWPVAFFIIMFILTIFFVQLMIYHLPSDLYANLVKNSLNNSEIISLVSFNIWLYCSKLSMFKTKYYFLFLSSEENRNARDRFGLIHITSDIKQTILEKTRNLELLYKPKLNRPIRNLSRSILPDIRIKTGFNNKMSALKKDILHREKDLDHLHSLISLAASRTEISHVEMCEHLFQFSPSMYWKWLNKLFTNFDTVYDFRSMVAGNIDSQEKNTKFIYDRVRSLLYENNRFLLRNENFMHYQLQNIAFYGFHSSIICAITSTSSSDAVKHYANAISRLTETINNRNFEFGKIIDPNFKEKFKYIYHKRKAHIGLDMHHTVLKLLKIDADENGFLDEDSKCERQFLEIILSHSKIRKFFNANNSFDILSRVSKEYNLLVDKRPHDLQTIMSKNMQTIHQVIVKKIEYQREQVRANFIKNYGDHIVKSINKGNLILITYGYSKMVRDVIKYSLSTIVIEHLMDCLFKSINVLSDIEKSKIDSLRGILRNCSLNEVDEYMLDEFLDSIKDNFEPIMYNQLELELKKWPQAINRIKIIVFMSEEEQATNSRVIKYSLTEERIGTFTSVFVSNPSFIFPLLSNGDSMMILLGGESYDNEKKRIVRTSNYISLTESFIKDAIGVVCNIFDYKLLDQLFKRENAVESDESKMLKKLIPKIREQFRMVFLIEDYKFDSDFNRISELFDDQYEKIEMYLKTDIMEVCSCNSVE